MRTIHLRFRLAQALLGKASGPIGVTVRAEAASALRSAHDSAAWIGPQPLVELIGSLAAWARTSLDEPVQREKAHSPSAPAPDSAEDELARLGLSPREIEVLAVLTQGRTNRQIGRALFITEKAAAITRFAHSRQARCHQPGGGYRDGSTARPGRTSGRANFRLTSRALARTDA